MLIVLYFLYFVYFIVIPTCAIVILNVRLLTYLLTYLLNTAVLN